MSRARRRQLVLDGFLYVVGAAALCAGWWGAFEGAIVYGIACFACGFVCLCLAGWGTPAE